jgi:hypothetical protein
LLLAAEAASSPLPSQNGDAPKTNACRPKGNRQFPRNDAFAFRISPRAFRDHLAQHLNSMKTVTSSNTSLSVTTSSGSSRLAVPAAEVHIPLAEFIAEGIKIQPRFVPEPIFAKTGVGFMRSARVSELAVAKTTTRVSAVADF